MSSEEGEPDLPVAAKDGKEVVRKSDAEEAIREAREEAKREERQKIREKIEEKIEYENGISTEEADRPAYAAHTLEILRDELEEEVDQS